MSGLESLYQELILDHAKHPLHRGAQAVYDAEVHHVNPTCGDEITLRLRLAAPDGEEPAGGEPMVAGPVVAGPVVAELTWQGQGCSISQASASVMAGAVQGVSVDRALELSGEFRDLMDARGEIPAAVLDDEALQDAVAFAGVARYPARIKCALLGWMAMKDALVRAARDVYGKEIS